MKQILKRNDNLTSRQWKLFNYLLDNAQGIRVSERKIIQDTCLYGEYQELDFNNTIGRRKLTRDIRRLKRTFRIHKYIISDNNGIMIGTKEQAIIDSKKNWDKINKMIVLQKTKDYKAGINGQCRLVLGYESPIIESFAKVDNVIDMDQIQPTPEILNIPQEMEMREVRG